MVSGEQQSVIFIHGLSKLESQLDAVVNLWRHFIGFDAQSFPALWYSSENLKDKLERLVALGESLKANHRKLSLIGLSAGGSFAFNGFSEHKDLFDNAINVGGRLRRGEAGGLRSFLARTASSQSFRESIIRFEDVNEPTLTKKDRRRMMTVRALLGDELVPKDTNVLEGAQNRTVPSGEHSISNILSVTLFAYPLVKFLKD